MNNKTYINWSMSIHNHPKDCKKKIMNEKQFDCEFTEIPNLGTGLENLFKKEP